MGGVVVPKLTEYRKTVDCAPDKSVSVRAVIFNGYATGSATVKNISLCADVMSAAQCMRERPIRRRQRAHYGRGFSRSKAELRQFRDDGAAVDRAVVGA